MMGKIGKAATAAALFATGTVGLVQPAVAHGDGGAALAAGIIGLGIGAAIASDHPHYHRHYYYGPPGPVYYGPPPGYYPPPPMYYAPPPPPYGYYGGCGWRGCW